jgi:hypothetical protein
MSADVYRLQELIYNDEGSFLENANSMGSNTYASTNRIPFIADTAVATLNQERITDQTAQAKKSASRPGYLGLRSGSLEFSCYIPGVAGGAGAPTATWFHDLLSDGLGGEIATDDGGTVTSATDADTFVTTGVTAISPGTIIFVGAKGDGRGDGQAALVSSWSAGSTQLLTALPGTPASPDVVHAALNQYPTEGNPTVTKRFLMLFKTTGATYQMLGCQLEQITFEIPVADGGPIKATFRYQCALWDQVAASSPASLPSGFTMPACDVAVQEHGRHRDARAGSVLVADPVALDGAHRRARTGGVAAPVHQHLWLGRERVRPDAHVHAAVALDGEG